MAGRRKIPKWRAKTRVVSLRLTKVEWREWTWAAQRDDRTLASWVVRVCREALRKK